MKFTQTNPGQLEYKNSGVSTIVIAGILLIVGIGVAILPIVASAPWWTTLIGLLVIAFAVYMTFSAQRTSIVLRNSGVSEITSITILTKKQTTQSFESGNVASVALETNTRYRQDTSSSSDRGMGSGMQRERSSVLYVQLKDNNQVVIATESGGSGSGFSVNGINLSSFGKAPLSDEAAQLAAFFNVPLNSHEEKPLGIEDIGRVVGQIKQGLSSAPGEVQSTAATSPAQPTSIHAAPSAQEQTSPTGTPVTTPASPIPSFSSTPQNQSSSPVQESTPPSSSSQQ